VLAEEAVKVLDRHAHAGFEREQAFRDAGAYEGLGHQVATAEYVGGDGLVAVSSRNAGDEAGEAVREKPLQDRLGVASPRFQAVLGELAYQPLLQFLQAGRSFGKSRGKQPFNKEQVLNGSPVAPFPGAK
jgi:hypothetical protein